MSQLIAVPRETFAGEKRVASVPEVVERLIKLGFRVAVESGAGDAANFSDDAYRAAGAEVLQDVWPGADIIFKVRAPSTAELGRMREGQTLVSFIWPAQNPELMQSLAARKLTRIVVTKRGRPVAILSPPPTPEEVADGLFGCLKGQMIAPEGFDFTAPVLDEPLNAAEGRLYEE